MSQLAKNLVSQAIKSGAVITTAESCTGGGIATAITDIAGSSAMFDRGFVTYSNGAKFQMLGVRAKTLLQHGAVSEDVAREMADGALKHSDASLAIAVTGIAGPGASDSKSEGRVCFALAALNAATLVKTTDFGALGRAQVRASTVDQALQMLIDALTRK